MSAKQLIVNGSQTVFCGIGLVYIFFTVLDFTYFLSVPNTNITRPNKANKESWTWSLIVNMSLLSLFILQHSLLAYLKIKQFFNDLGLQVVYRSLYVITTAMALQYLMKTWQTIDITLWQINLDYRPSFWLYVGVHTFAWLIIYVGNICTDLTELVGVKQVYYSVLNLPDPNYRKSAQLQRLNSHMRHPSFLGFILIFWLSPIMSLDRMLLASIFSLYMYLAWNTDEGDYVYQKYQYDRKYHELQRLNKYSY